MKLRRSLPALAACLLFPSLLVAAPIDSSSPRKDRTALTRDAESYLGVPYLLGGTDSAGLDCSGLVFLAVDASVGVRPPRTARELQAWTEPVARDHLQPGDLVFFNTTGKYAHVGVYLGDGRFVHAASDGPRTGVIVSGLAEPYWNRTYACAGRILPPNGLYGLRAVAGAGVMGWPNADSTYFRGAALFGGISYAMLGVRPGLELRPEWDSVLGVGRLPIVLSLGVGDHWTFFAGPALVLGSPSLEADGAARSYEASGGLLAAGGVRWTPRDFFVGGVLVSPYVDIAWQRYVPNASLPDDYSADTTANFRASAGFRVRWDF